MAAFLWTGTVREGRDWKATGKATLMFGGQDQKSGLVNEEPIFSFLGKNEAGQREGIGGVPMLLVASIFALWLALARRSNRKCFGPQLGQARWTVYTRVGEWGSRHEHPSHLETCAMCEMSTITVWKPCRGDWHGRKMKYTMSQPPHAPPASPSELGRRTA